MLAALSSLRLAISAIATACRIARVPFDRRADDIYFAMRRLTRELGTAPKQARAELLTADLVKMLPAGRDLRAVRDRALLLIGFAGGFRRSELVAIDVEHLTWRRDGAVILLPRSKTDQEGAGQVVPIVYGKNERTCPLRALKAWLAAGEIAAGPVFRVVSKGAIREERMHDVGVWRAVKRYAEAAGLDPSKLGAHSLRVGHVTQALENGAPLLKAKAQMRHSKLETTERYYRGTTELFRENTSGKLGL